MAQDGLRSRLFVHSEGPARGFMTSRDSKRFRARTILFLLSALALGLLPAVGWAQGSPSVPDHAYIDFGDHWRCDRGFKRVANRCEEIPVPEHAFLEYTGSRWQCARGR